MTMPRAHPGNVILPVSDELHVMVLLWLRTTPECRDEALKIAARNLAQYLARNIAKGSSK